MKTKNLNWITLLFIVITIGSCQKDLNQSFSTGNKNDQVLNFNSKEELNKMISLTLKMPISERKQWAIDNKFQSFGVKCDEIYLNANVETYKSIEQFKDLISKNSDYLYLEEVSNAEYSLETKYGRSPYRYIMNNDHLFQVNDTVYKVLENSIVKTHINNIVDLSSINENNYTVECQKNSSLRIDKIFSSYFKSATAYACGYYYTDYQSDGNDRTVMYIDTYPENFTNNLGQQCSRNKFHYWVRPYHRTLGIWYYCQRTIMFCITNVKAGRTVFASNNYVYDYFSMAPVTTYDYILEDELVGSGSVGSVYNNDWGFAFYHCWGDTPSAPTVNFNCGY
jgi:hypothetical protein